MRTFSCYLCKS